MMIILNYLQFFFTSNSAGCLATLLDHILYVGDSQMGDWLIFSLSLTKHSNKRWNWWVNTQCPHQGGLVSWFYSFLRKNKKFITEMVWQCWTNYHPLCLTSGQNCWNVSPIPPCFVSKIIYVPFLYICDCIFFLLYDQNVVSNLESNLLQYQTPTLDNRSITSSHWHVSSQNHRERCQR